MTETLTNVIKHPMNDIPPEHAEEELYEVDESVDHRKLGPSPTAKDVVSPEFKARVERQNRIRTLKQGIRDQERVVNTLGRLKIVADDQARAVESLSRRNELLEARLSGFELVSRIMNLQDRSQLCENSCMTADNGYSPEHTIDQAGELMEEMIKDLHAASEEYEKLSETQYREIRKEEEETTIKSTIPETNAFWQALDSLCQALEADPDANAVIIDRGCRITQNLLDAHPVLRRANIVVPTTSKGAVSVLIKAAHSAATLPHPTHVVVDDAYYSPEDLASMVSATADIQAIHNLPQGGGL